MLKFVTDALSNTKVAVNPEYVVAVFTVTEGENAGKTALGLINGQILVQESDLELVALFGE
jgi:hypothetical protein